MSNAGTKRPHWAWPHVIGVLIAMVAYMAIFEVTGDSDLFIVFVAIATGAAGGALSWFWFSASTFARKEIEHIKSDHSDTP